MEDQYLDIIKGRKTATERASFFRELEQDPEQKKAFMAFEKLWVLNNMAFKKSVEQERQKKFRKMWRKTGGGLHLNTWQMLSGVAAVIIATLLVTGAIVVSYQRLVPEILVLNSPKGNISQLELEDGSKIWLNSGSQATVKNYGRGKICVELEGEGFFDVEHNPGREFIVNVGDYSVHDVGTQFNVEYNALCREINVALFEGAVDFRKGDRSLKSDLQTGQMLQYDLENHQLTVNDADLEFVTAWKEGKFVFVNRTMREITKELEDWYDVHFIFNDETIKKDVFSGVIKRKTSLEHLLRVLRLSAEVDYQIKENEDGSFTVIFQ
ncbi:FecR family protein [Marinilabilia sp.]|uniref:FecR family protein n=1 Tax=Marinilabilia sp. TaxID=2021252 RepID=UPI0025C0E7C0|nr:FecR family protein [Marinilabilia sp.]